MTTVGALLHRLSTARGTLPEEQLRELAERILDDLRPQLNSVMEPGTGYELQDAMALLGAAAGDLLAAADDFALAKERTDTYLCAK
ncbi:hypothetical protein [Allokutzneria sp. NRRL B-24872]|uniref:hypothetical protein n=1 Tax=Allokutzneria sp. NRRL B-24872 TaxID=1137961 RepID=UPI000A3805DA|nr:hypothetical protein [Allokutzneria sp. NRRL B-24872]